MKRKQFIALALMSVMIVSSMAVLSSCGDSAKKKDVKAKTETAQSKDEAKVPELTDVKTAAIEAVKSTDLSKLTAEEKASVEKLIADYEAKINEAKDADAVEKLHTEYAAELKKLVGEKAKEDETKAATASETAVASSTGTAIASSGGSSSSGSSSGSAASTGSSGSSSSSSSSSGKTGPPEGWHVHNRDGYQPGKEAVYEEVQVPDGVEKFITGVFVPYSMSHGVVTIGPGNIPAGATIREYNDGGKFINVNDPAVKAWVNATIAELEAQWGEPVGTWQWWNDERVTSYHIARSLVAPAEEGYYYCTICGERQW